LCAFAGGELINWINRAGIINNRSDSVELCTLLTRSGLIDQVPCH